MATFCASARLLSPGDERTLLLQALVYAGTMLLALRLGRGLLPARVHRANRIARQMIGNALGFAIGGAGMALLGPSLGLSLSIAAIVVASITGFFVLGTLSPLLDQNIRASGRRSVA